MPGRGRRRTGTLYLCPAFRRTGARARQLRGGEDGVRSRARRRLGERAGRRGGPGRPKTVENAGWAVRTGFKRVRGTEPPRRSSVSRDQSFIFGGGRRRAVRRRGAGPGTHLSSRVLTARPSARTGCFRTNFLAFRPALDVSPPAAEFRALGKYRVEPRTPRTTLAFAAAKISPRAPAAGATYARELLRPRGSTLRSGRHPRPHLGPNRRSCGRSLRDDEGPRRKEFSPASGWVKAYCNDRQ